MLRPAPGPARAARWRDRRPRLNHAKPRAASGVDGRSGRSMQPLDSSSARLARPADGFSGSPTGARHGQIGPGAEGITAPAQHGCPVERGPWTAVRRHLRRTDRRAAPPGHSRRSTDAQACPRPSTGRSPARPAASSDHAKPRALSAAGRRSVRPTGCPVEQRSGRPFARTPAAPIGGQRRRCIHERLTNARELILAGVHPWTPPALQGPSKQWQAVLAAAIRSDP
jgi:hypothetical protein